MEPETTWWVVRALMFGLVVTGAYLLGKQQYHLSESRRAIDAAVESLNLVIREQEVTIKEMELEEWEADLRERDPLHRGASGKGVGSES